jgi:hypothetical protein
LCEDLDDFDFCLCEEDDLDEAASFWSCWWIGSSFTISLWESELRFLKFLLPEFYIAF